ncbi:hypothetical protein J6590_027741 [Homalodisca vitripennis]|nr:hypothetical protein J6590_027741 [Homalodisca vitripennis]
MDPRAIYRRVEQMLSRPLAGARATLRGFYPSLTPPPPPTHSQPTPACSQDNLLITGLGHYVILSPAVPVRPGEGQRDIPEIVGTPADRLYSLGNLSQVFLMDPLLQVYILNAFPFVSKSDLSLIDRICLSRIVSYFTGV